MDFLLLQSDFDGYEVYRFCGAELGAAQAVRLVDEFFDRLPDRHASSS
jgi:hypothetical protein